MADFDRECDAALDAARKNVADGKELIGRCETAFKARTQWERENGIDAEKRKRFFEALSPEDRKKVEEENEAFERELAHDLEGALAGKVGGGAGGRKRRDYL